MRTINLTEFAAYWNTEPGSIPADFEQYWRKADTRCRRADKKDLEGYLELLLNRISGPRAQRTEEENRAIFENGWAEHREPFLARGDLESLFPRYVYNCGPYSLGDDGDLYLGENQLFSLELHLLHLRYIALSFLRPFPVVHEFGSGSGLNLMVLAETNPGQRLVGYEWTDSGTAMADFICEKKGYPVSGRRFDMLRPDYAVDLAGEAVLTLGSIEQLGDNYQPFLDFLLAKKPALVVNIEPGQMPESGGDSLYLRLAALHMNLRGYPSGLTQTLLKLEMEKKLSIISSRRLPWLAAVNSVVCTIWKPL